MSSFLESDPGGYQCRFLGKAPGQAGLRATLELPGGSTIRESAWLRKEALRTSGTCGTLT